mgnify:FL=1|jgi:hypothetical protein|tara:strand:+ start:845 stop:1252 length:408 start_codon:yes stop_codon:yes gene_type:complete
MEHIELSIDDLLEVTLKQDDDFLKVKETLTRIGVSSRRENKLYQSCHILHKRGKYYIVHFKELFALDGLPTDISETDLGRRNAIANLLDEWELLEVVDIEKTENPRVSLAQIKILSYNEKKDWELIPKYHIGRRR